MRLIRIIIVLLLPLIAEVVISCCDCPKPFIKHYTNKLIEIQNIDNSGSEAIITTANSVPKEAFGIRIRLHSEKTACVYPSRSFFIQTASATKCDCPPEYQILASDSVTAIQVFTLNDFDTNHPANSDISDYFKVFQRSSFITIADYIKSYRTVLYDDNELDLKIDLLLMTPPATSKSYKFEIKITLSDGRILEGESTAIKFI